MAPKSKPDTQPNPCKWCTREGLTTCDETAEFCSKPYSGPRRKRHFADHNPDTQTDPQPSSQISHPSGQTLPPSSQSITPASNPYSHATLAQSYGQSANAYGQPQPAQPYGLTPTPYGPTAQSYGMTPSPYAAGGSQYAGSTTTEPLSYQPVQTGKSVVKRVPNSQDDGQRGPKRLDPALRDGLKGVVSTAEAYADAAGLRGSSGSSLSSSMDSDDLAGMSVPAKGEKSSGGGKGGGRGNSKDSKKKKGAGQRSAKYSG